VLFFLVGGSYVNFFCGDQEIDSLNKSLDCKQDKIDPICYQRVSKKTRIPLSPQFTMTSFLSKDDATSIIALVAERDADGVRRILQDNDIPTSHKLTGIFDVVINVRDEHALYEDIRSTLKWLSENDLHQVLDVIGKLAMKHHTFYDNIEKVKEMENCGISIECGTIRMSDNYLMDLLYPIIRYERTDCIKILKHLVESGRYEFDDIHGRTVLRQAIQYGNVEIMKYIYRCYQERNLKINIDMVLRMILVEDDEKYIYYGVYALDDDQITIMLKFMFDDDDEIVLPRTDIMSYAIKMRRFDATLRLLDMNLIYPDPKVLYDLVEEVDLNRMPKETEEFLKSLLLRYPFHSMYNKFDDAVVRNWIQLAPKIVSMKKSLVEVMSDQIAVAVKCSDDVADLMSQFYGGTDKWWWDSIYSKAIACYLLNRLAAYIDDDKEEIDEDKEDIDKGKEEIDEDKEDIDEDNEDDDVHVDHALDYLHGAKKLDDVRAVDVLRRLLHLVENPTNEPSHKRQRFDTAEYKLKEKVCEWLGFLSHKLLVELHVDDTPDIVQDSDSERIPIIADLADLVKDLEYTLSLRIEDVVNMIICF
jgi:hypothetical protein